MDALILTIIATSIPLLLAATGELITEKSGLKSESLLMTMKVGLTSNNTKKFPKNLIIIYVNGRKMYQIKLLIQL